MDAVFANALAVVALFINAAGLCVNSIIMMGVIFAFWQVKAARDALKAQMQLRVIDEWRNPELYRSMAYINSLRQQWKAHPVSEWHNQARQWVNEHAPTNRDTNLTDSARLVDEWNMRRTAAQFLAKMGSLIENGYLDQDVLFAVDPEIGRQLAVLIPIDQAIQSYWSSKEPQRLAEWDQPFPKWEFDSLWKRYQKWYWTKGQRYKQPSAIRLSESIESKLGRDAQSINTSDRES